MYKRASLLYGIIAFSIGLMIVVIYKINIDYSVQTLKPNSSRKLTICTSRGYIYDRNLIPLVNEDLFTKDFHITKNKSVREIAVNRYGNNQLCTHIIGYIDGESNGVSGIEKSYNDVLSYYSGELSISYYSSGIGGIIGELNEPENTNFLSKGGVVLTIDKNIQYITEKCADEGNLEKGAVVVMEVKTGQILAICSRPNINPRNIEKHLTENDSPLINRALTSYSVGSVFKPIIAACCLENGTNPNEKYVCKGFIKIYDTIFPCNKADGHGELDLYLATANSCNTYYINLTRNINGEKLINNARNFGFGQRMEIADNIYCDSGELPNENTFSSGEKANFSFGQGCLTATPVHLAAAYAVIGNNGLYNEPIIVKSLVDENQTEYMKVKQISPRRVISEKTAKTVLKALKTTVEKGSGKKAKPENTDAVGKTATAQSGWYENGIEITHSWFVGMFPVDDPKYVVVVMKEDGKSGSTDCAPIFKNIAQLIVSYE